MFCCPLLTQLQSPCNFNQPVHRLFQNTKSFWVPASSGSELLGGRGPLFPPNPLLKTAPAAAQYFRCPAASNPPWALSPCKRQASPPPRGAKKYLNSLSQNTPFSLNSPVFPPPVKVLSRDPSPSLSCSRFLGPQPSRLSLLRTWISDPSFQALIHLPLLRVQHQVVPCNWRTLFLSPLPVSSLSHPKKHSVPPPPIPLVFAHHRMIFVNPTFFWTTQPPFLFLPISSFFSPLILWRADNPPKPRTIQRERLHPKKPFLPPKTPVKNHACFFFLFSVFRQP